LLLGGRSESTFGGEPYLHASQSVVIGDVLAATLDPGMYVAERHPKDPRMNGLEPLHSDKETR